MFINKTFIIDSTYCFRYYGVVDFDKSQLIVTYNLRTKYLLVKFVEITLTKKKLSFLFY